MENTNNLDENKVRQIVNSILSQNQYSVAKTSAHEHNGIDSARVQYNNLSNAPSYFCVASTTTGTTAVNVFGSGGANFSLVVTSMSLISNDTTAGNISAYNNGATIATIAKGTTSGGMVGATSVANTTYSKGKPFTITSTSAGNATVLITFTT